MNKGKNHKQVIFSVCKVPNFACQLHEVTFHSRFKWCSGRMNRPVSTSKKRRRCPIALCTTNKGKKRKQVVFSVCKVPNFAFQLDEVTIHLSFQRQSGSNKRPFSTCKRGRRCPIALCTTEKGKKWQAGIFFRVQSGQLRLLAAWS